MKISKDRLKQIIKEELAIGVAGGPPEHDLPRGGQHDEMGGGAYPRDQHGYEGEMSKTNLWKIAEYAQEMHDLIHDDEDLEPWVEEKIAVATDAIETVAEYMEYEKLSSGHEHGPDCGCFEE